MPALDAAKAGAPWIEWAPNMHELINPCIL